MASRGANYSFNTKSAGSSKKRGNYSFTSNSSSSNNDVQKRIKNYKTRLKNIDKDTDITDKRNPIEKFFNLKKDQNVLFDIFELLGRPQQALYGAIDAAQKGKDVSEGAEKGWKGKKEYTGGQLLRQAGMKGNGKFNLFDKKSYKNASASDFLGFGLDMMLDPVDLSLIGVTAATGGAAAPATVPAIAGTAAKGAKVASKGAKVVKTANTVSDASKAIKAANAVKKSGNVYDVVRTADKASDAVKTIKRAGDVYDTARIAENAADATKVAKKTNAFKRIMTRGAKPTGIKIGNKELARTSLSQILMNTLGEGVKGTGKLADLGVEKWLTKLDSNTTRKIEKLVNSGVDLETATRAIGKSTDKLQTYRDIKKGAQRIFDSSKNVKGLIGKGREADNLKSVEKYFGEKSLEDIRKTAETIAKRQGDNSDKVYREIMSRLSDAVESNADWSLRGSDVINKFKAGKTADFFTENQAKDVQKVLDNFGIKTSLENGRKLTLNSQNDVKKLYSISDAVLDENTGIRFSDNVFGRKMTDETFNELEDARKYFESNPELKALYDKVNNATYNQAKITGNLKGINPENIVTEGYVRHNLNKDIARSQVKAFDARKYDAPIREVNKMKKAEFEAEIASTKMGMEKLQKQIYKTDDAGELVLDKAGKPIRDDNLYNSLISNKENFIANLNKQIASYQEIIKKRKGLDINPALLSKKGEKSIETIERVQTLSKELDDITAELKNIKLKDISPENAQAIKNLLDDYKTYTKKITALKNYAAKSNVDEVGGLLTRKEQVKGIFENIQNSKKRVTASITEAKNLADDTNRKLIKDANKSFKDAYKKGEKYAKLYARFKTTAKKVEQIYQNANDMVDSLTKRLNYEKATLDKLKGAGADTIFNQKLSKIDELSKSINTLTSESGKEFFTSAFDMNFADYIKNTANYTTGAKKFNDALISGVFNDSEFVKTADQLTNNKIPYGFEKVNGSYLYKKLSKYEGTLSDEGRLLINDIKKYAGQDIYMDKELVNMLDVGTKVISNEVNPLLKVWDGINNTFKKFSTLSPGFQIRNIIGNSTDMVLSGMPSAQLPSYWKKATSLLNDYDNLAKKAMDGALEATDKARWASLVDFHGAGFDNAYAKVQNLDSLKLKNSKNPINLLSQKSMAMNENMDRLNRMTLYLYAKDNPKYLTKLGVKNPIDAVRKVLFDPDNMSAFEKGAAKRFIPFYTFTKQNLMFQMDNMMKNTPKYHRLYKGLDKMYDSLDENQYHQYQKEGMQIPLPWTDDKGNQMFLKANLPLSDLGEWMSNPLRRTLSSTTPILKTPIEMVTGKDVFTGNDVHKNVLNDFTQATTGQELSESGKKWATRAEQLLSGLGIDTITTNNIKKVSSILKNHNGDMDSQAMWAEIFRSVLQNTNQSKIENAKAYQEMLDYQEYVKSLKNQGTDVPTIKDITTHNKTSLTRAKRRRSKRGNYSFN